MGNDDDDDDDDHDNLQQALYEDSMTPDI